MTLATDMATVMKQFLEIVQPLPVRYGYARGIKTEECYVTYMSTGVALTRGIGNSIIGERQTFIVTVQTRTAAQNMLYSHLIRRGTHKTAVEFVSENARKDTTVKDGWINTIIVYVYDGVESPVQQVYTKEQARIELQNIADLYIFVTSMYDETLASSFIDKFTVPELDKEIYSYDEFLSIKQEYLDRLLYTTTEY